MDFWDFLGKFIGRPLLWRATGSILGLVCELDGARSQKITKVEQIVLTRLMENSYLVLSIWWKEQWCLPAHLSPERADPTPYPETSQFSFSLYFPGILQAASPEPGSKANESVSKKICWPLKRNAWDSSNPLSYSETKLSHFHSQIYGNFSSKHCYSGWVARSQGENTHSSGDVSAAEVFLLILNFHIWV